MLMPVLRFALLVAAVVIAVPPERAAQAGETIEFFKKKPGETGPPSTPRVTRNPDPPLNSTIEFSGKKGTSTTQVGPDGLIYKEIPAGKGYNGAKFWGRMVGGEFQKDGDYTSVNDKGQIVEEGKYAGGRKTGVWKQYQSGVLKSEAEWSDNKKNGWYRQFMDPPHGNQILEEGSYLAGEKIGVWKSYHDNGSLSAIGSYTNDKKEGGWRYYDVNTGRERTSNYKDGKLVP